MKTTHEVVIPLRRPLRNVLVADPQAPLAVSAPPAMPTPVAAPEPARVDPARAAQEQRWREEREAIERTLASLLEAARTLEGQHRQRLTEMQRVAVELAVAIASRLIHAKIEAGEFNIQALVQKAVEQLDPRQPVTMRLNPQDLALLQARMGGQPLLHESVEVRLVPDPALGRGDCRAEAGDVSVLSQLPAQLEEVRKHLLRSVGHAEPESRPA